MTHVPVEGATGVPPRRAAPVGPLPRTHGSRPKSPQASASTRRVSDASERLWSHDRQALSRVGEWGTLPVFHKQRPRRGSFEALGRSTRRGAWSEGHTLYSYEHGGALVGPLVRFAGVSGSVRVRRRAGLGGTVSGRSRSGRSESREPPCKQRSDYPTLLFGGFPLK